MKYLVSSFIIGTIFFSSCNDCTITELEDPQNLDCPDLMLNIGDVCDDDNPETINDTISISSYGNCICMGSPINMGCYGILYASRIDIDGGSNLAWYFDQTNISDSQLSAFDNIEQKQNGLLNGGNFMPNDAAYNPLGLQYVMAYQLNVGTPNPLYNADIGGFSSVFLEQEATYAAPVFLQEELYAINLVNDGATTQYNILSINQQTGVTSVLYSENITTNSPKSNDITSSASSHADVIYFISGSILISYNPSTDIASWQDIDPSNNPDLQKMYIGLEYRQSDNQLLAMRGPMSDESDKIAQPELVSINPINMSTPAVLFDIAVNLGSENDEEVFYDAYSSTFSQCDNAYYFSELYEQNEGIKSFLISIDLDDVVLQEQVLSSFVYGLELVDE